MFGLILIISSQIFYAIGAVILKKYLSAYNPLFVNILILLSNIVLLLPILFIGFKYELSQMTFKSFIPFFVAGIFWLGIAETLYVYGFQKSPLGLGSLATLFFPLFSTILGVIIFHETLTIKTIIGGILMFGGFLFLTF